MTRNRGFVALAMGTLGLAAAALTAGIAEAAPQDYRFEAVEPTVKSGSGSIVTVRLVHIPTGKPVPDAVITQRKAEMPMAGMSPMAGTLKPAKPDGKGNYTFEADLGMEGEWSLALAAKVQGEPETVRGTVKVKAAK